MLKQSNEQDLVLCADSDAFNTRGFTCTINNMFSQVPPMTELLSPNLRGGTLEEVQ